MDTASQEKFVLHMFKCFFVDAPASKLCLIWDFELKSSFPLTLGLGHTCSDYDLL